MINTNEITGGQHMLKRTGPIKCRVKIFVIGGAVIVGISSPGKS